MRPSIIRNILISEMLKCGKNVPPRISEMVEIHYIIQLFIFLNVIKFASKYWMAVSLY